MMHFLAGLSGLSGRMLVQNILLSDIASGHLFLGLRLQVSRGFKSPIGIVLLLHFH